MKTVNIKALARKFHWWWRTDPDPEFTLLPNGQTRRNNHPLSLQWKDGFESAAHAYELARRLCRDKKLPPFPELDAVTQAMLKAACGGSDVIWVTRISTQPFAELMRDPTHTLPIQFNLQASDRKLLRTFKQFLREQRTANGVMRPKPRRRNSVSWRWLELWDMNELANIPLDNSGHGAKAKAKKSAERVKTCVLGALAAAEREISSCKKTQ